MSYSYLLAVRLYASCKTTAFSVVIWNSSCSAQLCLEARLEILTTMRHFHLELFLFVSLNWAACRTESSCCASRTKDSRWQHEMLCLQKLKKTFVKHNDSVPTVQHRYGICWFSFARHNYLLCHLPVAVLQKTVGLTSVLPHSARPRTTLNRHAQMQIESFFMVLP